MRNILKGLCIGLSCLLATSVWAADATFTMASIFDGNGLSFDVTSPVAATVSSNTSKSNAKAGKLGSDGHYFQIVLKSNTFTAASINGYINTTSTDKNWAFQFSTDGGNNWSAEATQANDGNKTAHDIAVGVTIPANANGFRVIRRAGTATVVNSITLTLAGGSTPVAVTGVTLNKTSLTLEAGQSETLTATVKPDNADDKSISWESNKPSVATIDQNGKVNAIAAGTAKITVTTTDGGKTATCDVTVTAPAAPIPVTAISIKSAITIGIGESETLEITYTPADANQGKAVKWESATPSIATVDANGKVTGVAAGTTAVTATSTTDPTIKATCNVTVKAIAVTGVSLNKTTASIKVGNTEKLIATIAPENATNKNISWESDKPAIATVNNGVITGVAEGTAKITVKTEDGNKTATCNVTVTAGTPVPQTDLMIHYPEVYEASEAAGGYNTPLTIFDGSEYEVYYFCKISNAIAVGTSPISGNIATTTDKKSFEVKGTWMKGKFNDEAEGGTSEPKEDALGKDEFKACYGDVKMGESSEVNLHIKGFNEFSIYAIDNNTTPNSGKKRWIDVYIDDLNNPVTTGIATKPATVRRYSISSGEHVIKLSSEYSGSKLYAISLRVPKEPRTKYLKGNDSTQKVLQTQAIQPIVYVTKYNNISGAETRLEWIGNEATGITLQKIDGSLTDTLVVSGTAQCKVGTYNYAVVAYYNNVETSRATGSFKVATDIRPMTELNAEVYQNEEMDQIQFRYYALDANDVQLNWTKVQPAGITGKGAQGNLYIIGGTPTAVEGLYPYTITVAGADTTFKGTIRVKKLDYGTNPVLYLYKNTGAEEKDGVYSYLANNWNMISRKAKEDGMRTEEQYAKYKWILISEDADANNPEVLGVVSGKAKLPVLNMNAFTYAYESDDDTPKWGEPDNGSISKGGCYITIQRDDHPIFQAIMKKKRGDRIQVLDSVDFKGLMPVNIKKQGTLCLATSPTRDIEDYFADGEMQTIIHEIPASMHGGSKYIAFPIAKNSSKVLTSDGKKLLGEIVNYLTSNQATVKVPTVQITGFSVNGIAGVIDQEQKTIQVNIDRTKYPDINLKEVQPVVTVASEYTYVVPATEDTVDLSTSSILPVKYVVSDYINRTVYNVTVTLYTPEGIEEIYTAGDWVNVYDIFGRKIATTNEDIFTMSLPRGVYVIVTESGKTLKITR